MTLLLQEQIQSYFKSFFEVTLWDLSKPNYFFRNWGHKIIIDTLLESSQVCSKFIRKGWYVFCQAYVYTHVIRKPRLLHALALDLVGCMQLFLGFSKSNDKRKIWLKEKKTIMTIDLEILSDIIVIWIFLDWIQYDEVNYKQHRFCIPKDLLFNLSFYELWHKKRVDLSRERLRFSFLVSERQQCKSETLNL